MYATLRIIKRKKVAIPIESKPLKSRSEKWEELRNELSQHLIIKPKERVGFHLE